MSNKYDYLLSRKGATRTADVPADVLDALNCGVISTVNLTEWLMVDNLKLLQHVLKAAKREALYKPAADAVATLKKPTTNSVQQTIGTELRKAAGKDAATLYTQLATHQADSVRCWAAYFAGTDHSTTLAQKLHTITPLAADPHFGVREVTWLATRPAIAAELATALQLLSAWSQSEDANIRRFASESTRPRGVWCAHINELKENPAQALHLLEPLRSDTSEYVRNSVANWLNDAAKTQPQWVQQVCKRWLKESPVKETQLIVKRALRSL
ncbi:MAG: DNA alkylation repair protein [Bacteroidia bacterium]|nr:DNA alkylation repair protein [Bacteroidia bacterium]